MSTTPSTIRIPVLHYEEITDSAQLNGVTLGLDRFITNDGGKQYLVEVWA
jgi:hypothetical protein